MVDREVFELRKEALSVAQEYIKPICESYPPEEYSGNTGPSMPFSNSATYVVTAAEQAVNLMITIASWLVDDE